MVDNSVLIEHYIIIIIIIYPIYAFFWLPGRFDPDSWLMQVLRRNMCKCTHRTQESDVYQYIDYSCITSYMRTKFLSTIKNIVDR